MKRGLKHVGQRRAKKDRFKLKRPKEERMKLTKGESEGTERALKVKKNLEKKLLWLEDENLMKQTGWSTKYANTKLPADPRYPLAPK